MLFQSVQPTMWMLLITVCIAHLDLMQTHHPCKQMFCPLQKTHAYDVVILSLEVQKTRLATGVCRSRLAEQSEHALLGMHHCQIMHRWCFGRAVAFWKVCCSYMGVREA